MRVAVYDTIGHLRPVFTSRARSKQRLAIAQEAIFGPNGVAAWLRMSERERDRGGYEAMDVARVDGSDVLSGHQVWGLFDKSGVVAFHAWCEAHLPGFLAHGLFAMLSLPGWAATGVPGIILAFLIGRRTADVHE